MRFNQKFTAAILAVIALLSLSSNVAAASGDIVDYVLYTDIVTYIDNQPIQSYNINGYTAVVAEDLEKYGFDVEWNGSARSLYITRDVSNEINGNYTPSANTNKVGDRAMPVYDTDIVTYFNGQAVTSYNIDGRTIVYVDDLAKYGSSYVWDGANHSLSLTLDSTGKIKLPSDGKLALVSVTSPINRNAIAKLTIKGKPNTEYSIGVYYSTAMSEAEGLENKTSDSDGYVTWEWKVGGKTNAGEHKIVIKGGDEVLNTAFVTTEISD